MKKQMIVGIAVIACVTLCAAVWPRNTEVGDLPAEPVKTAASAKVEARSEETPQNLLSAVGIPAPEAEPVAECEPNNVEITTEKEMQMPAPPATPAVKPRPTVISKSTPTSADNRSVNKKVVDGKPYIYVPGFGWIEDHSGESGGTFAADMYENGNKIGVMGGGTTVGNLGDELTGNKVGIMGGDESALHETATSPVEQPEITGDVIYTELQPPVTKDSTPPQYKPNGEPINP